jgi:Protein of unknown function (DUF2889)
MPLPAAAAHRQLKHRRQIDVQVFSRGDGFWEVEATLVDTKTRDAKLATGLRPAGTPIHEMKLRLVVDQRLQIIEAGSETLWMPYPPYCAEHGDAYAQLVGMNLLKGFRAQLREKLGGVLGCTHITELAQVLPTAVIQAFAGEVIDTRGDAGVRPYQIDRCHALAASGPVVQLYYPKWATPAVATAAVDHANANPSAND